MAIPSIQSGQVILQKSQNMATRATEELNEQARIERARAEEGRMEQERLEVARLEETRLESQLEKARLETARLEESQVRQEQELEQAQTEDKSLQRNQDNVTTAQEQRDINEQKEQEETKKQQAKSIAEAATQLSQAKSYNKVGASVVQRNNDMIGSMLDISV